MNKNKPSVDDLKLENAILLQELEESYKNTILLLEASSKEKKIAYQELEKKYEALEKLYKELSDKRKMLIHLDKLSSIGQFIVEIIHELKNPLSVISVNAQLLSVGNITDEIKQKVDKISSSTNRMTEYLSRFRRMIYNESENFRVFNLNGNLTEFLETIELIKPVDVTINTNLVQDKLHIKGDPYQIQQIFFNLAKNAFDAMDSHKKDFLIETQKVTSISLRNNNNSASHYYQPQKTWNVILSKYEHFVIIRFSDTGSGISEENLKSIFQPFYTTKSTENGTGLGLSISSDIIKSHEGNIAVKSMPGQGTTFQVILPVVSCIQ